MTACQHHGAHQSKSKRHFIQLHTHAHTHSHTHTHTHTHTHIHKHTHTYIPALCGITSKPFRCSSCSFKLQSDTKTNYISHPSWVARGDTNQPCGEGAACDLGGLKSCKEHNSKLTFTASGHQTESSSGGMGESLPSSQLWVSLLSSAHCYLLLLLFSPFTLSGVSELTCCSPSAVHLLGSRSAVWSATHSQWASSLARILPPPLSLFHSLAVSLSSHTVSHSHICALNSSFSTLFVYSHIWCGTWLKPGTPNCASTSNLHPHPLKAASPPLIALLGDNWSTAPTEKHWIRGTGSFLQASHSLLSQLGMLLWKQHQPYVGGKGAGGYDILLTAHCTTWKSMCGKLFNYSNEPHSIPSDMCFSSTKLASTVPANTAFFH